jgi:hypothetical protein
MWNQGLDSEAVGNSIEAFVNETFRRMDLDRYDRISASLDKALPLGNGIRWRYIQETGSFGFFIHPMLHEVSMTTRIGETLTLWAGCDPPERLLGYHRGTETYGIGHATARKLIEGTQQLSVKGQEQRLVTWKSLLRYRAPTPIATSVSTFTSVIPKTRLSTQAQLEAVWQSSIPSCKRPSKKQQLEHIIFKTVTIAGIISRPTLMKTVTSAVEGRIPVKTLSRLLDSQHLLKYNASYQLGPTWYDALIPTTQQLYTRQKAQVIRQREKDEEKKVATGKRMQRKYTRDIKAACGRVKRQKTSIGLALNAV